MKVLYYTACSYFYPGYQVVLNQVMEDIKAGNDIYWAYCNKALSRCCYSASDPLRCGFCKLGYKNLEKKLKEDVTFIPVNKHILKDVTIPKLSNYGDLKAFEYKGVKIGHSILSLYISSTRNNDGTTLPDTLQQLIHQVVPELCGIADNAETLVDTYKLDAIKIYNGRLFENRFFYDIAIKRGIHFTSLEVSGGYGEPFYPMKYEGGLPHSVKLFTEKTFATWDESTETEEIKIRKGSDFFERRRNGKPTGDKKIYVKNQEKGLLPEGYDKNRYNVVIFNSSSDEIAALGGDWEESFRLFKTQYEACKYILENTPSDIQYYLRIHPNLTNINYSYHTDLYKLQDNFPNIVVIPPDSQISTYSLLDVADKVITFGSTIGAEACYWGKPSLLVGMSYYRYLGLSHYVASKEELIDAIVDKNIPVGNRLNAIKYAYFLMDREFSIAKENNVSLNLPTLKIGSNIIPVEKSQKIVGSSKLYAIMRYFLVHSHLFSKPL